MGGAVGTAVDVGISVGVTVGAAVGALVAVGAGVSVAVGSGVGVGARVLAGVGVAAGLVIWGSGVIGNCEISTVGVTGVRAARERRPNVIARRPIVNTARADRIAMRMGWGLGFWLGSKRV